MMFSGIVTQSKTAIRGTAVLGLVLLLIGNYADMTGYHLLRIDVHKMLFFDTFGLLGNSIAFGSTLMLVLLSPWAPHSQPRALPSWMICGYSAHTSLCRLTVPR